MGAASAASASIPMTEPKKVVFPYGSLAAATADNFQKIGGETQAFRMLVQGYKFLHWRRNYAVRTRSLIAKAKALEPPKK